MQAAIDRVLRSFSFKPAGSFEQDLRQQSQRDEAEAMADRLLRNFKGQLARNADQRH